MKEIFVMRMTKINLQKNYTIINEMESSFMDF